MPLRTRLLLSLILIAAIPLVLFGFTAYLVATNNLRNVERDSLEGALDSVNRALLDVQNNLANPTRDNSNWDDLHDQVAKEPTDQDWMRRNFSPDTSTSTVNTFKLDVFGLWRGIDKIIYSVGPAEEVGTRFAQEMKNALSADSPYTTLAVFGQDVYIISFAPLRTSEGKDPNGILMLGRRLGADDVAQIKALTGYDVALYQGLRQIAATQTGALTPAPDALQSAAKGQKVFDQNDPNIALAYRPVQDGAGNTIATVVVWRSRQAIAAAQSSIALALALWFVVAAVLAAVVGFLLGRSITRPLLAMADSATQMAGGDLSQRVVAPSQANDELGRLASAFNEMASKVGARVTESEGETHRLQAIDEYRLNLLNAIAQSLHTPLNTIKSHSEALDMSRYGTLNEAQRRSTSAIRRAAAVEEALLADLVDFARAQQKQLRFARDRVELEKVVKDVAEEVVQRYADKHIHFTTKIPPNLPMLFADHIRLQQILDNLLSWAFNYSLPNSEVELLAEAQRGQVAISVSDTSNGLSDEEKTKLFDLFYHPESGWRNGNAAAGNGLGLALVKVLVEQQDGKIRVDVIPKRGNIIVFSLPSTD